MIDFIQVKKQFGTQVVLDHVSFRINPGERVGVVGPNGAGKSTIFALICGEQDVDEGDIQLPRDIRLGHLHQQLHAHEQDTTLLEYTENAMPELKTLHDELHALEHAAADGRIDQAKHAQRIGDLQHRFEDLGGYEMKARAEAALSGLGFHEDEFNKPFRSFSGGWQMRAEMVRTLIAQPDILLLDEPSNYLDLPAVEWLQRFLKEFKGTMLLISHDRYLLESLTDQTLEIHNGDAVKYSGGFAYYLREREQRREQQAAAYRNYTERKEQLESFIRRFRAKATKAVQVQSRIKMLEKMESVKPPPSAPDLSHLRLAQPPRSGAHVMQLEDVGFTYDGKRWVFRNVNMEVNRGDKIALVGYNGMGKTTLLRLLAGKMEPGEGVRREGHHVVTGYQSQDFAETMSPNLTVYQIVKQANPERSDKDVRTLLGSFGFSGDAVNKACKVLSGGEKIRLAFARIFICPPNFLLLDEPTTHLDIYGCEALERAVRDYEGTVVLVSHDVTFVRHSAERIIALDQAGISSYPGGYDYYLEKRAAAEEGEMPKAGPAQHTPADKPEDAGAKGREGRVARARQREAAKGLQVMEKEMEVLNEQRNSLCEQLSAGDAAVDYQALNRELDLISKKLVELERRWMEEAEKLEPS